MRILHVVGGLNRGGAETWLVEVLRYIDRERYSMDFLVHTANPGAYDREVRIRGGRIIPCQDPSHPLLYAMQFQRILETCGPYAVVDSHIHYYSGYVLMLAALSGVPVRIAHSHIDARASETRSGRGRGAYRSLMRSLIRRFATRGLAVSTGAADDLFGPGWQRSPKWQLQHLGIDLARFETAVEKDSIRAELAIDHAALVIGHVGRFVPQKNHAFLVEVAREVVRREPRAVFLLIGDGPLRPVIEARVAGYSLEKHFVFAGLRPDVPRLMKGVMDLFLFPSRYEGLPLTLLEAQAAGIRSIASDAVSRETDVVGGLVVRQPLDAPAKQWAERVLEHLGAAPLPFSVTSPQLAGRSIAASVARLTAAYGTPEHAS